MRILIADDSRSMRLIVTRAIRRSERADVTIFEASDGPEALELAEKEQPELLICDLYMPSMSGMEVLQQLRVRGNLVRFILMTADGCPEMAQRAIAAGASSVLFKPFPLDTMQALLTSFRAQWSMMPGG